MNDNDKMKTPQIRLDHINIPAKKPHWLAEWYAEMFGFQARDGFVISPGALLVFEEGEPANYQGKTHFGFRCDEESQVVEWANKLAVNLDKQASYTGFKASDPEGNVFEVYWEGDR